VELAPDQVLEDGGAVAELVDVVELERRDLGDPRFLPQAFGRLVVEEQVELDVREPVPFSEGEGAVHKGRHDALVLVAQFAGPLDHDLLRQHPASSRAIG
jgi:hypothetical protein